MAVVKYRDENGNYVAVPTGIPNAVSAFENDAGYITEQNLQGLASEEYVAEQVASVPTLNDYFIQGELATVAQTGSYKDLNNKPDIPVIPTEISSFNNDAGYTTAAVVQSMINASLPASAEEVKY